MTEPVLTRRALLGATAAGAATLAATRVPAWARPLAQAASHVRRPDSLPFPHLPAGHASMPQIEHIVVLIMENHSFDNMLGMVPARVPGRQNVDGFTIRRGQPTNFNRTAQGHRVFARPAQSPCQLDGQPSQTWNASHESYANGANSGFVRASGPVAMRFWDEHDIPFTYSLARHFPIGQRYFCSVLAQTYPNLRYFFCGTSSGLVATDSQTFHINAANGTIFDRLDAHHVSWGVYYEDAFSPAIVPGFYTDARKHRVKPIPRLYADAHAGRLPNFTYICPNYDTTSEENPQDMQVGEEFVDRIVRALIHAPAWRNTALFLTYD
ncbi:MAG: alkaline phosphatase family protein [Solirubrobacteraceae bacterium]